MIDEREYKKLLQRTARMEAALQQLLQPKSTARLVIPPSGAPFVYYLATIPTNWDTASASWSVSNGSASDACVTQSGTDITPTASGNFLVEIEVSFGLDTGTNQQFNANERLEWETSFYGTNPRRGGFTPSAWYTQVLTFFPANDQMCPGMHNYITDAGPGNLLARLPTVTAKKVSTAGVPSARTIAGFVNIYIAKLE